MIIIIIPSTQAKTEPSPNKPNELYQPAFMAINFLSMIGTVVRP